MNRNTNLPSVGDRSISAKFAFGYYHDETRKLLTVDGETEKRPVIFYVSEEVRVAEAARTGNVLPKEKTVELGAYDPSRAKAIFVVEAARMEGGDKEASYPDGWRVSARRLNEDESYDPNGEVIHFYMSGQFQGIIKAEDVQIVGKMQKRFV